MGKTRNLSTFNTEQETTELVNLMFMFFINNYFFKTGKSKELKKDYLNANKEYFKLKKNIKGEYVKDANYKACNKIVGKMMKDIDVLQNRMDNVLDLWHNKVLDDNITFKVYGQEMYNKVMTVSNLLMLLDIDDFLTFIRKREELSSEELLIEMRIAIQRISNQNLKEENEILKRQ